MMKQHAVIAGAGAICFLLAVTGCSEQSQSGTDPGTGTSTNDESRSTESTPTGEEPDVTEQARPAAPTKQAPAIRGTAEVALTNPVTERVGNEIVTIIRVKNTSTTNAIAGLKIDEFWYDRAGVPITGDTFRHRKPLQPGEIVEVTLRTPVNPRMDRNQFVFVHANGDIKTTVVPKL